MHFPLNSYIRNEQNISEYHLECCYFSFWPLFSMTSMISFGSWDYANFLMPRNYPSQRIIQGDPKLCLPLQGRIMGSFISSSRLVVSQWSKTWREVAWNPYHFYTKPLFGKIGFATIVEGFRIQYLVFSFWIKCIRRWWGLPIFGPGGGGKVLDHPVGP